MDHKTSIHELKEKVRNFCEDRDWDQFHGAKELAIGISTEASELLQHFRFKSDEQVKEMLKNPKKRQEIHEEVADVFYFILRLAQLHEVDLTTVLSDKIEKNNDKYPVEKAKGSNLKYSEYEK